jgi:glycosyltransferase involved in cell wall biosynthesis
MRNARGRVLLVANEVVRSGAETQLVRLAVALRARGDEVRVYSLLPTAGFQPELEAAGVEVTYAPAAPGLRGALAVGALVWLARRWRPDVVVSFVYQANVVARLAAAVARVPTISSVRNEWFGGPRRQRLLRLTDRLAMATVINSRAAATRLTEVGVVSSARATVIPNALALGARESARPGGACLRRQLGVPEGGFVWVALGRLVDQKDLGTALRAFAAAADPGDRLWVVGDGPRRSTLEALATSLELAGAVRFFGFRDDTTELLAACDGLVLSSAFEGTPNAILEAMVAARPVVATEVGDVPHLVERGRTGFTAPPGDVPGLASAMRELRATPRGDRARMGERARARALAEFDHDAVMGRWFGVIDAVARGRS